MKFIHISDLHIGKKIKDISLLEDQKYILSQILDIIKEEQPQAVLIAGDIYDYGVPPANAVPLLNDFFISLSEIKLDNGDDLQTFVIYGNHDSPERVSFANYFMARHGIHISPVFDGKIKPFVMNDEFGEVCIYMLPFIRPANVYNVLTLAGSDEAGDIRSYTDAVKKAVSFMNVDTNKRNVLVSHQYITGSVTCESELQNVGGIENVDADAYKDFNYVALGHLHTPQFVNTGSSRNVLYYSGSPLSYSFKEEKPKSVAVVTIGSDGSVTHKTRELSPLRRVRTVTGTLEEIKKLKANEDENSRNDFVRIVLTGENVPSYDYSEARSLYSNFVTFGDIRSTTSNEDKRIKVDLDEKKSELDIFKDFFMLRRDREPTDEESNIIIDIINGLKNDIIMNERGTTDDETD